ncbi:hypothetical protein L9F63_016162, partial [Diploptera punctata]
KRKKKRGFSDLPLSDKNKHNQKIKKVPAIILNFYVRIINLIPSESDIRLLVSC